MGSESGTNNHNLNMKLNQTTLMAALALGSLLTLGPALNAQNATPTNAPAVTPPPAGTPPAVIRGRGNPIDAYTRLLALTDDQKPKVQAVLDDQRKKLTELRQDTTLAMPDKIAKRKAIQEEVAAKFKEILTPEQFVKYQRLPQMGRRPTTPPPAATAPAAAPAPAPAGN